MSTKVQRNAPCPCGSGKKYKKCCLNAARAAQMASANRRDGVQLALAWLNRQYPQQIDDWVEQVWLNELSEDERRGIATADARIRGIHDVNLLEYLVAEGRFEATDERPLQLILGNKDLGLDDDQRAYLAQLGEQPLRLYRVHACVPGEHFDVVDVMASEQPPVSISDPYASRMLEIGDTIGLRLLHTPQGWESSGAIYHIPDEFVDELQRQLEEADANDYSRVLVRFWLRLVSVHV